MSLRVWAWFPSSASRVKELQPTSMVSRPASWACSWVLASLQLCRKDCTSAVLSSSCPFSSFSRWIRSHLQTAETRDQARIASRLVQTGRDLTELYHWYIINYFQFHQRHLQNLRVDFVFHVQFVPVRNLLLSGLDVSLFTVSALHQLLRHSDDAIQLATPTQQLSQEVLEEEANVTSLSVLVGDFFTSLRCINEELHDSYMLHATTY